ncbi:MAG: SagB family peptide dehydrogenase [Tepidisphaerales bacterium]
MSGAVKYIELSPETLERVGRVFDYHNLTKHTRESVRKSPYEVDWENQPSRFRTFDDLPRIELPQNVGSIDVDALELMRFGTDALPAGFAGAPQTLATLATWLFLGYGITGAVEGEHATEYLRTCPSAGGLYPCELYVAAFGIQDLEPGLYHYSPSGFCLSKLREGDETLGRLRRGRPDLDFLKTVPAAILVSTIFWRSAWKYRDRGYRFALLDSGHLVENLRLAATGLGMTPMVRLRMNDAGARELIGVPIDAPFGEAEAVQAMVIWADKAENPMSASRASTLPMPPIARAPLSPKPAAEYLAIGPTHQNCVGPGQGVRDVLPPLTDLSPIPEDIEKVAVAAADPEKGAALSRAILLRRSTRAFAARPMAFSRLAELNWRAFRGGTYSPLRPAGPHAALVRPFWFVHAVEGLERGIWYYHPVQDSWSIIRHGDFRQHAAALCVDQEFAGTAGAVCFMVANLVTLLTKTGPDAYRLAHLEAGVVGQRLALAATAMGLGAASIGAFYDDDARRFLGLNQTGWELLYCVAVGEPGGPALESADRPA